VPDEPPKRRMPKQIEVVDEAVAAILRQKTTAERIALASQAHRTARNILTARTREEHPDWSDEEVQREVARRLTRGAN
jgi:Rv0078B-related antitoxin